MSHTLNPNISAESISHQLLTHKTLIIIPAYNEEGSIRSTIQDILSLSYPLQILVINDGSKDKTAQEAKAMGVDVVSLPFNLGIGGAVQTGFQFARDNNFDIAVQVDADGQHDVKFLANILEPIFNNGMNMTIGSRFIPPFLSYRSAFVRRIGINFFARLISFLTGCKISDPTSGFRAFDRKCIDVFARYYPQDFPEPEAIVVARRYNAKIIEVPVTMRKRVAGHSSIRYLKTLYYMIKVTVAILLDKLKAKEI